MRPTSLVIAFVAIAAALFFAAMAEAKGPFVIEVSGGGLRAPVTLPGIIQEDQLFAEESTLLTSVQAAALPSAARYELTLYEPPRAGASGHGPLLMTMVYYPPAGGRPALIPVEARCFSPGPELQAALDRALDAAPAALPDGGGPPAGDGASPLWYIAPSLALAGALITGLAGRRLLFRRNV